MNEPVPTNLVRAYCDGELDAERARAIEQRAAVDADLAARIRFEHALRKSVERTLIEKVAVPPEVVTRIRAALEQADPEQANPEQADPEHADPEPIPHPAGPRANVFAVAASLALVAGAVLFGIFGKPIDQLRPTTDLLAEVARYASDEHRRCAASARTRLEKIVWSDPAAAQLHLERYLGAPVSLEALAPTGYRFAGATLQELPGHRAAAHLIYARGERGEDGCPEALLSIFITPDVGQFDASLGASARAWATAGEPPECSKRVLVAADGSLVYFLVSCNESRIGDLAAQIEDEDREERARSSR